MLKVVAYTQGVTVPSARFRIRQLIPSIEANGISIREVSSKYGSYPPVSKPKRPIWLARELMSRFGQIRKNAGANVSILQREFISTLPTLEFIVPGKKILDVDDAIWLHRNGAAANNLARHVDHIVCGNSYLADYFSQFGKPVTILPTVVDTARFAPIQPAVEKRTRVIGWSGTSSGYKFVKEVYPALAHVLSKNVSWKLRIVSDRPPEFVDLPPNQFEFIKWSAENEAETIADMDIGIMPLEDDDICRGKCSYKMLLYMASGVPVVVSDFGMNSEILQQGDVGLGATQTDEWISALQQLIDNPEQRAQQGNSGRALIERKYSLEVAGAVWTDLISVYGTSRG